MRKIFYLVLGCVGLALGAVGAVIPLLPAFPFLLLAAFSFSRSSERLNHWFLNSRLYKENLESYVKGRGMTARAKVRVCGTVTACMVISAILLRQYWIGLLLLGIIWVGHLLYFTYRVETIEEN